MDFSFLVPTLNEEQRLQHIRELNKKRGVVAQPARESFAKLHHHVRGHSPKVKPKPRPTKPRPPPPAVPKRRTRPNSMREHHAPRGRSAPPGGTRIVSPLKRPRGQNITTSKKSVEEKVVGGKTGFGGSRTPPAPLAGFYLPQTGSPRYRAGPAPPAGAVTVPSRIDLPYAGGGSYGHLLMGLVSPRVLSNNQTSPRSPASTRGGGPGMILFNPVPMPALDTSSMPIPVPLSPPRLPRAVDIPPRRQPPFAALQYAKINQPPRLSDPPQPKFEGIGVRPVVAAGPTAAQPPALFYRGPGGVHAQDVSDEEIIFRGFDRPDEEDRMEKKFVEHEYYEQERGIGGGSEQEQHMESLVQPNKPQMQGLLAPGGRGGPPPCLLPRQVSAPAGTFFAATTKNGAALLPPQHRPPPSVVSERERPSSGALGGPLSILFPPPQRVGAPPLRTPSVGLGSPHNRSPAVARNRSAPAAEKSHASHIMRGVGRSHGDKMPRLRMWEVRNEHTPVDFGDSKGGTPVEEKLVLQGVMRPPRSPSEQTAGHSERTVEQGQAAAPPPIEQAESVGLETPPLPENFGFLPIMCASPAEGAGSDDLVVRGEDFPRPATVISLIKGVEEDQLPPRRRIPCNPAPPDHGDASRSPAVPAEQPQPVFPVEKKRRELQLRSRRAVLAAGDEDFQVAVSSPDVFQEQRGGASSRNEEDSFTLMRLERSSNSPGETTPRSVDDAPVASKLVSVSSSRSRGLLVECENEPFHQLAAAKTRQERAARQRIKMRRLEAEAAEDRANGGRRKKLEQQERQQRRELTQEREERRRVQLMRAVLGAGAVRLVGTSPKSKGGKPPRAPSPGRASRETIRRETISPFKQSVAALDNLFENAKSGTRMRKGGESEEDHAEPAGRVPPGRPAAPPGEQGGRGTGDHTKAVLWQAYETVTGGSCRSLAGEQQERASFCRNRAGEEGDVVSEGPGAIMSPGEDGDDVDHALCAADSRDDTVGHDDACVEEEDMEPAELSNNISIAKHVEEENRRRLLGAEMNRQLGAENRQKSPSGKQVAGVRRGKVSESAIRRAQEMRRRSFFGGER